MTFPNGFLWESATSSYRVEGAWPEDGNVPNIWAAFSQTSGTVKNGDSGDVTVDHYQRDPNDIALVAKRQLQANRFSFSWARLFPDVTGQREQRGLDFHNRLVDTLLHNNITPMAAPDHSDCPAALKKKGGSVNRDSASWFFDFSALICERSAVRIDMWATLNEPRVSGFLGMEKSSRRCAHGLRQVSSESC
jgi:beta-glucosidase